MSSKRLRLHRSETVGREVEWFYVVIGYAFSKSHKGLDCKKSVKDKKCFDGTTQSLIPSHQTVRERGILTTTLCEVRNCLTDMDWHISPPNFLDKADKKPCSLITFQILWVKTD